MSRFDADVIVVGAGAAGLSLATHLSGGRHRVILLDRRAGFAHDRTFSGFRVTPHPFEGAIERTYRYVALHEPGRDVVRAAAAHPYVTIPGDLFYETALRAIGRGGNVEISIGREVRRIDGDAAAGWVDTDAGTLRARMIFDARGALPEPRGPAAPGEVGFVQRFLGRVVRTERPIFVPERATLMDFRVSQDRGPHFVYVLPRSAREALVEDTYFAATDVRPTDVEHADAIDAWLAAARAGGVEVLREERGALPMTTVRPRPHPSPRVRAIGIAGGAAKPSTGYAFAFIQREAARIARVLAASDLHVVPQLPAARSATAAFLDGVFLAWMRGAPREAARVFCDLFERAPIESVARFLSEAAGPLDHARVMAVMPTAPFLRIARERLGAGG